MKVGIISVFTDYHRAGAHHRGVLQPQVAPLIAALLPPDVEVHIVNDAWDDPDWDRDYDLLFLSCLHSDFDRARQISHYWRRRGAKTVLGGTMASTYTSLCAPYFDAIAVGDPETTVPEIVDDFGRGELKPVYFAAPFDARRVRHPRLEMMTHSQVLPLAVEATRGCPFTCEFCVLTGIGTRFHTRSADSVACEIAAGQRSLKGLVPWWLRHIAIFYDNNLGGNPVHMRQLCDAFAPLGIRWGACVTFNVICDPANLKALAKGGCRCVFVGLETFNAEALRHMGKHQNVLARIRAAVDLCHEHGILVMAGLMLSPTTDSIDYIDSIPRYLRECGLHVPTYVCFETPFPGTPHFRKLAASGEGAFMPNTLLRDLNGYTLAVPPQHASPGEFVDAYKRLWKTVYSRRARFAKVLDDLPRFARGAHMVPILFDLYELFSEGATINEERTFLAGQDIEPPEAHEVPLTIHDFESEDEYNRIMRPWGVSDERGRSLPMWNAARPFYRPGGRVTIVGAELVSQQQPTLQSAAPAPPLPELSPQRARNDRVEPGFPASSTHRDPLFALRRAARNLRNAGRLVRFPEMNTRLPGQAKPLYVVFVHGGLSCCFDAFDDLFRRIEASLGKSSASDEAASFLRFEHDTHHPIGLNAERLCALVADKLAPHSPGGQEAELILVAHSRGGLVARLASDYLIERAVWSKERLEVFTYGSPHLGTPFFESEVTWAIDYLIRFAGILQCGLERFAYQALQSGVLTALRRHARAWLRRGVLLGPVSGSFVLARRRLAMNFLLGRAVSTRNDGPNILRWPRGIEDVRESSEFIRNLAPVPRCPRFWAFGSTYDLRENRQKLDVFSKRILTMVQRAFVLAVTRNGARAARRLTERNDLVVSIESATAVGMACRINDNLWHCGYFSAAPGETLAQYLKEKVLGEAGGTVFHRAGRAHYIEPNIVTRAGPPARDDSSLDPAHVRTG